jgi:dihydropteroate synthase
VSAATHWRIGPETELDLSTPQIMGILNLTPDSFSDGGQHDTIEAAAAHAERMVLDGAAIIDVGGESTRPGAERIDAAEQIRRVVPVIEAIRSRTDIPISIDTTLAEVARAAIDSGATIINDVSAGVEDQAMLPLASERRCGIVLMHRLCPPDEDSWSDQYSEDPQYGDDVVGSVLAWLFARAIVAMEVGISSASICLDPGLGFGKTVLQNWQLIAGSERLAAITYPVLAASSRKSFVGAVTGIEQPEQRDEASVAVAAMQYAAGLRLFRVHNVSAHRHALAQLG